MPTCTTVNFLNPLQNKIVLYSEVAQTVRCWVAFFVELTIFNGDGYGALSRILLFGLLCLAL